MSFPALVYLIGAMMVLVGDGIRWMLSGEDEQLVTAFTGAMVVALLWPPLALWLFGAVCAGAAKQVVLQLWRAG